MQGIIKQIAFLLLFVIANTSYSQKIDSTGVVSYQVITDLEDQWQVYDEEYQAYVPYIRDRHGITDALYLELNVNNYRGYSLLVKPEQPVYLFVQAELNSLLPENQELILDFDSLAQVYKESNNKVLFTFYNEHGHLNLPTALIVYNPPKLALTSSQIINPFPLKFKAQSQLRNFVIIAAIILLSLYAFAYNYHPKAFKKYYSLSSIFFLPLKEDTVLISRPLSRINLLFMFNHSFLLSFFYILIQRSSDRILTDHFLRNVESFGDYIVYFFLIGMLIFVLLIGKYFFISVLGNLFKLSQVVHLHFYEYLLFSKVFYSFLVLATFFIFISFPYLIPLLDYTLILAIIIFNFIRIFIINFALNKLTTVRNLYLFSYLCATELTPLLIGIKFLLNR